MTPEKWQQAKKLYESALKLSADERRKFLAESCAGDEELQDEIESLPAAADTADIFCYPLAKGPKESSESFLYQ